LTGFIVLGATVAIAGLAVLVAGLRAPVGEPKRNAMLIGGTMATAFGVIIGGFAIAYESAPPLDLNSGAAQ
jgi:hypothetical protein